MTVKTILPNILTDNEVSYFEWLLLVSEYSCPDSEILIASNREGYNIHITPANPELRQSIVDNMLAIHKMLGLKIKYSSSLKISKKVSFFLRRF